MEIFTKEFQHSQIEIVYTTEDLGKTINSRSETSSVTMLKLI